MGLNQTVAKINASQAPEGMSTRIIAVDGPGGAGKSTFATQLSKALERAPIIQTDDFASWDNPLDWWPRLLEQVLKPLSHNEAAHYQRYDWEQKKLAEWRTVEPTDFIILEGISSSRKVFRPYLAYSIWVDTPRDVRLQRGLERDGEDAREQWDSWMAEEDAYIKDEKPQVHADETVSGIGHG